jgi:hypothetical protein
LFRRESWEVHPVIVAGGRHYRWLACRPSPAQFR